MITRELRELLQLGKYTKWAAELPVEQLAGLLWGLGEYGIRATPSNNEAILRFAKKIGLHERAIVGLMVVLEFPYRNPRTVDQVRKLERETIEPSN